MSRAGHTGTTANIAFGIGRLTFAMAGLTVFQFLTTPVAVVSSF